jgi:hypothetical protein
MTPDIIKLPPLSNNTFSSGYLDIDSKTKTLLPTGILKTRRHQCCPVNPRATFLS